MKLCKDCKHFKQSNYSMSHKCVRIPNKSAIDIVTGTVYEVSKRKYAYEEREAFWWEFSKCGEGGRFFSDIHEKL